ncbi:periplasmic binding protein-like I [Absidia repens]|uniref:Periplasmic binding protein-like I n=1 Tax=Absidia repens TaxID=90262 RepID=A0A1X2I2C6_9FUNG|nr:periplasmic binding protein-like I [Absidia repens]
MAVNTINSNQLIPGAYVTLIQKDSYPDGNANEQSSVTSAVYSSVTLMQQGVIGIIGDISSSWTSLSALMSSTLQIPQCSFASKTIALSDKTQYKYFFRSIPTQVIFADVMLSFAALQGWSKIGIIYSDSTLGQQFFQRAIIQAGNQGLEIAESHSFDPAIDLDDMTYALQNVTQGRTRVIIVAATDTTQTSLMVHAASMGYMTNEYTWLLLGVSDNLLQQSVQQYNQNHTNLPPLDYNTTFNGLFMFDDWLSLKGYGPFDSFLQQWSSLNPQTLAYSCMMVMATGFKQALSTEKDPVFGLKQLASGELGETMLPPAFNVGYVGPNGPMIYDSNGDLSIG